MARKNNDGKKAKAVEENGSVLGMLESKINNIRKSMSEEPENATHHKVVGVTEASKVLSKKCLTEEATAKAVKSAHEKTEKKLKGTRKKAVKKPSQDINGVPTLRSFFVDAEYVLTEIAMLDKATGAEIALFNNLEDCISGVELNYGLKMTKRLLLENLFSLSNSIGSYVFKYTDESVKSPYANLKFHMVNAVTGNIMCTGTLEVLSSVAKVSQKFILDAYRSTANNPTSPKKIASKNAFIIACTDDYTYDVSKATSLWANLVEFEGRMFPAITSNRGKVIACFANVHEACGVISKVANNPAVLENIRRACYNETSYMGFKWSYKTAKTYIKNRWVAVNTISSEMGDTDRETTQPFSASEEVHTYITEKINRGDDY